MEIQQERVYVAENVDKIVNDLFIGKLSLEQALQKLRTRLLDLSSRNRLLNYRFPKGRSIQFVNKPNLNLVFNRLIDSKPILIKYVPEPPPDTYSVRRPDSKSHSEKLGIDISVEFDSSSCSNSTGGRTPKLQALYYPADLEKFCRKLSSEARTVIEETGTNMLYLVFGFLEFYDREDTEKPMLAPLLAVPATLEKGNIDLETRTYQYSINYSGEDIHENLTLREKLNQDFTLQLPEFEDDDEPGSYFLKIQQAIEKKKRWKVRYQLTLGFLSFGKLAIWDDLDPKKSPGLLKHPLLKEVFSGASSSGSSLFPEDYEIDNHPQGDTPIIYDADSSQHSAIIDVLSGKNMVINGPPGTGKSQTITNIIAAGLRNGKKILFISEKLAALEVVRHRLNQANLGHFCLELHSHKTQKKKLLNELQERLDERFHSPQQLQNKISTLKRHKKELNRYAELMASCAGNELGLTIHEVFWRTERRRQTIGDLAQVVQSLFLDEASNWSYDDIEYRRAKLESLGQLHDAIGSFNSSHPWWGFIPKPLAPGDDESIGRIVSEALHQAEALSGLIVEYYDKLKLAKEPQIESLLDLNQALNVLTEPPEMLKGELLSRIFTGEDSVDKENCALLATVIKSIENAKALNASAGAVLATNARTGYEEASPIITACRQELSSEAFSQPLEKLDENAKIAHKAYSHFAKMASEISCSYLPINSSTLATLNEKLAVTGPLRIFDQPIPSFREGTALLAKEASRLQQSFGRVSAIAKNRGIEFDGSPAAVSQLARSDGIEGVLPNISIDDGTISKAQKAADYVFSGLPLAALDERQQEFHIIHDRIERLLEELGSYSKQLNIPFDNTQKSVQQLTTLGQIAANAPMDLLEYRCSFMFSPRVAELIATAEKAQNLEKLQHQSLDEEFYLDTLPDIDKLKAALSTFRRGDGFFNFMNREWRIAKRLLHGISKSKKKRKASDYEAKTTNILKWVEYKTRFIEHDEYKLAFGTLFRGLETDFSKIRRLHDWYVSSHAQILNCPGLINSVDLTNFDERQLTQLASLSTRFQDISAELNECHQNARECLGDIYAQVKHSLLHEGWPDFNRKILQIGEGLKNIVLFLGQYVKPELSPKRAVEVLKAKQELLASKDDFENLRRGLEVIQTTLAPLLPGITDISCESWDDYLGQVDKLANSNYLLIDLLLKYADDNATPNNIKFFFETKLALDKALEGFATFPIKTLTQDWQGHLSVFREQIDSAARLVMLLKPLAQPGKTSNEVIEALMARQEAANIIQTLERNSDVSTKLQGEFQGIETNLEILVAALAWGQEVLRSKKIRNSELTGLLLAPEAAANFYWVKGLFESVFELRREIEQKLNEFGNLGSFHWDEWNRTQETQAAHLYSSSLLARIRVAASDVRAVLPWSKYHAERLDCNKIELGDFVSNLEQHKLPSASVGAVFEFVTYRSIGRSTYKTHPELEGFAGAKHEKKRAEFVTLDKEIISLTGQSFAYEINKAKNVPTGTTGITASQKSEMLLLTHEINKQKRHLPIRQLIKRAGRAIAELKPCFMMGPMSVAQYLEQGAVDFDMVVMDEASQLRPEEALGAIARGKQLVVVGDPKQLPPTNFFDRLMDGGDDDDEDETPAVLAGSESILDICQQLFHPVRTLRWHYRSQHESLIAFSNHHFYNGKLVVFPSPFNRNNRLGVRYRYIKNGVYKDRQNLPEAQRLVDAVVEHMLLYPEDSVGVVTLNQTQRDLIEDLLDKKIRNIEETQLFISKWEEEGWPFFVKNLENVQGDERDVIFISTTFGKAHGTDKVRQNFGPISRLDGWRRLNVLFTRARRKIELFTSLLPEDLIVENKTPAGTRALKDYLDFAKRGVLTSTDISDRDPDSDFEISVGDMLRNRNYEVIPQLGVAGFFIDLAIRNPDRPGEFLAAVECDGATYHSSRSARDRDCIRQTILESLGWKDRIWRIWSTDWFYDPQRESKRLLDFLEERRAVAKLEPLQEFDFREDAEEIGIAEQNMLGDASIENGDITLSISDEDLFVEIGDYVTYCFVDKPEERHGVMVVDSASNLRLNLINENTPLAKALLNSAVGDEQEMELIGNPSKAIRVLKIQRQENLPT